MKNSLNLNMTPEMLHNPPVDNLPGSLLGVATAMGWPRQRLEAFVATYWGPGVGDRTLHYRLEPGQWSQVQVEPQALCVTPRKRVLVSPALESLYPELTLPRVLLRVPE